jgi:hypothetical protein
MENLVLKGSEKTPYINLNHNGEMVFSGISMPEDAADFYFKIIDWISDYYRNPKEETIITVSFRYLNSSSASMMFKLFYCLDRLEQWNKSNVKCYWYYEESDAGMKTLIDRVMEYARNIDYEIRPTDNILDALAS